ncbi:MAG TPA: sigma-70 family RNA polymerase sigma factor [Thermoanaerobaculia bacterium]
MSTPKGNDEAPAKADEELMGEVASGQAESVGPLYERYAPAIFGMAARALGRPAAEEIVQEVFLEVWRHAAKFDAKRGPFRPWIFQIAHFRVANELRRRSRRPQIEPDSEGERLAGLAEPSPDPSEESWFAYRKEVLRSAVEQLPPPQRQALGLAFFQELPHDQIAAALNLPLGTAKSRIRAGLRSLRVRLSPIAATLLVLALIIAAGLLVETRQSALRGDRALAMLTSSESVALHLSPVAGVSPATHGNYRFRPGSPIAVITFSHFPEAPGGFVYQAWVRHGDRWISLGTATPDREGHARLIAEDPALAAPPDAMRVTLEKSGGSREPTGPDVIVFLARDAN